MTPGDDNPGSSSSADPNLLGTIDKLFELNVGDYVALPQLLVVGDQSSGKSSVLEGLTNLPFPRDSGLCTRFATQITFSKKPVDNISISIIPAENSDAAHAEKLRAWKEMDLQFLSPDTFGEILSEVHSLMGLGAGQKTFSDDVLKIEICGPMRDHLSVVDVPGIFKKVTEGVTTKADMNMVRNMVTSYMQNPRSVILAVIPANVDIATQEILDMANELDRKGERTLGVLTKPDLVDKGAEQSVVDLLEGKNHKLNLGWSIVRNLGQQQLIDSSVDRHANERNFFKSESPWSRLSKDKVGIQALHLRLKDVLTDIVRREFPNVKADINRRLKDCKRQLSELGPSREKVEQQHRYLLDMATRFQSLTSLALKAQYGGDDVFDESPSLKLATAVVNRNAVFSDDIERLGHTKEFEPETKDPSSSDVGESRLSRLSLKEWEESRAEEYVRAHPELEDILDLDTKVSDLPQSDILAWLEGEYSSCRGFELGTFDASLLTIIWKKQSVNWDKLTRGYISDIICLVHAFTTELLSSICLDHRVRSGLTSVLMDRLLQRYQRAIDHCNYILKVERIGNPLTQNHYFSENLEKSRQTRARALMESQAFDSSEHGQIIRLDSLVQTSRASNLEHTVQDLHDILHSYYTVARKRFVDVVCMQAADYYLVTGPESPVQLFSPSFVSELSPAQLGFIAGEDASTRRKRAELDREIANLEKGKNILI